MKDLFQTISSEWTKVLNVDFFGKLVAKGSAIGVIGLIIGLGEPTVKTLLGTKQGTDLIRAMMLTSATIIATN